MKIKLLICAILALVLTVTSFAGNLTLRKYSPPKALATRSGDVQLTTEGVNVLWLRDGLNGDYTAVSSKWLAIGGLGREVNIVLLGSFKTDGGNAKVYAGTGISVNVFKQNGWRVDLTGGLKGLDLTRSLRFENGRKGIIYGISVQIPVRW